MKRAVINFISLTVLVSLTPVYSAPVYYISRSAIGSAGGQSESSTFQLVSLSGQPAAGLAGDTYHVLNAGFWSGNYGCVVNLTDLTRLADLWLTDSKAFGYDFEDFSVLAAHWFCQCPPDWPLK